jgi:hypothetical protein
VLAEQVEQVSFGCDGDLYLFDGVGLGVGIVELMEEVRLLVEVTVHVKALLQHLDTESAAGLHHQLQHLVVATALKQEVAGEQLEQTASHCPHIYPKALLGRQLTSQNHLRCAVVSCH